MRTRETGTGVRSVEDSSLNKWSGAGTNDVQEEAESWVSLAWRRQG